MRPTHRLRTDLLFDQQFYRPRVGHARSDRAASLKRNASGCTVRRNSSTENGCARMEAAAATSPGDASEKTDKKNVPEEWGKNEAQQQQGEQAEVIGESGSMVESSNADIDSTKPETSLGDAVLQGRGRAPPLREDEYEVIFEDGPTGYRLDSDCVILSILPESQAAVKAPMMEVGDTIVRVGKTDVDGWKIQGLGPLMKETERPVIIRFRHPKGWSPSPSPQPPNEEYKANGSPQSGRRFSLKIASKKVMNALGLSKKEATSSAESLPAPGEETSISAEVAQAFTTLDTEKLGKISPDTCFGYLIDRGVKTTRTFFDAQLRRVATANFDITEELFGKIVKRFTAMRHIPPKVRNAYEKLDVEGSGEITVNTFVNFMNASGGVPITVMEGFGIASQIKGYNSELLDIIEFHECIKLANENADTYVSRRKAEENTLVRNWGMDEGEGDETHGNDPCGDVAGGKNMGSPMLRRLKGF